MIVVKTLFPSSAKPKLAISSEDYAKLQAEEKAKVTTDKEETIAELEKAMAHCLFGMDQRRLSKEEMAEDQFMDLVLPEKEERKPKVVFADQHVIIDSVDDLPESIRNHPAVQGMNNKDIRRAYYLSKELSITNTKALFEFGDRRREFFSDVVNRIVEQAQDPTMEQTNLLVEDIVAIMTEANLNTLLKTEKRGWLYNIMHKNEPVTLEQTNAWFDDAIEAIDTRLEDIDDHVKRIVNKIVNLDRLHVQNRDSFDTLQIEIAAGKFFIEAVTAEVSTATNTDVFTASEVAYRKMCLDQFHTKVIDMEAIAHSVMTNAPQIRLMQLNIQGLGERVKSVRVVYSRWKSQFSTLITKLQAEAVKSARTERADILTLLDRHSELVTEFTATQQSLKSIK